MPRPPVEWPIPVYVAELRDRLLTCFRTPGALLRAHVPSPLVAELVHGEGFVVFAQGAGRCLKPIGGVETLASEFRYVELFTPVRWRGACRAELRGNLLLRLCTDSPGLARLVRTALHFEPGWGSRQDGPRFGAPVTPDEFRFVRPRDLDAWDGRSVLEDAAQAESLLVHAERYFVPSGDGAALCAIPLHQYARRTSAAPASAEHAARVAEELNIPLDQLVADHVLFQKRCTHTWSFPPERIPRAHIAPPRLCDLVRSRSRLAEQRGLELGRDAGHFRPAA